MKGFKVATLAFVMSKDGAVGGRLEVRLTHSGVIKGQVVDVDGRGVGAARVALMDQGDQEFAFYSREFSETDNDGYFEIGSPPGGGRLLAIVAAAGYPTRISEMKPDVPEQKLVLYGGATVTVRMIEADGGAPIEGAQIIAMMSKTENIGGNDGNMVAGLTDHNGEAELEARPGFLPFLLFSHAEHGSGMYMGSGGFGGGMGMLEGPKETKIEPGDNLMIFKKKKGFIITGVVKDPSGKPMVGAKCAVGAAFGQLGSRTGLTDENGIYRMTSMMAMGATVTVTVSGYVQDPKTRTVTTNPESGNLIEHDVVMQVAASVVGRVVDPQGVALSGVQVKLSTGNRGFDMSQMTRGGGPAVTDSEGRFRIDNVVGGQKYHVVGKRTGYILSKTDDFQVENSTDNKAPDLEMGQGVTLKVSVVDASGRAVNDARVEVSIDRKRDVSWDFMSQFSSFADVRTNARGFAQVNDVPPGIATVTATAKGSAATRKTVTVDAENPPGDVAIRMREAVTVDGVVLDEDRSPVAGAMVLVSSGVGNIAMPAGPNSARPPRADDDAWIPTSTTTTDAKGRFEFLGMPEGTFTLTVRSDEHVTHTQEVSGRADGLQIELRKKDMALQGRIDELQKELMAVYGRMQSAKDDAERKALQAEAGTLSQEMMRVAQGDGRDRPLSWAACA